MSAAPQLSPDEIVSVAEAVAVLGAEHEHRIRYVTRVGYVRRQRMTAQGRFRGLYRLADIQAALAPRPVGRPKKKCAFCDQSFEPWGKSRCVRCHEVAENLKVVHANNRPNPAPELEPAPECLLITNPLICADDTICLAARRELFEARRQRQRAW